MYIQLLDRYPAKGGLCHRIWHFMDFVNNFTNFVKGLGNSWKVGYDDIDVILQWGFISISKRLKCIFPEYTGLSSARVVYNGRVHLKMLSTMTNAPTLRLSLPSEGQMWCNRVPKMSKVGTGRQHEQINAVALSHTGSFFFYHDLVD